MACDNYSDKVSIIVPVYNVEQYIRQCIDSLINQTYFNIEILLVDDGSSDDCPKICDEYAKKDCRIKVIHQQNRGLSAARNAGLDVANGSWISFVDSDDYIMPDMIDQMVSACHRNNTGMCSCGKYRLEEGNMRIDFSPEKRNKIAAVEYLRILFLENNKSLDSFVWDKLFDCRVFDNIRFPIGVCFEESKILYRLIERSQYITVLSEPLYVYRIRMDSLSNSGFCYYCFDLADNCKEQYEYYKQSELMTEAAYYYIEAIVNSVYMYSQGNIEQRKGLRKKFNYYKTQLIELLPLFEDIYNVSASKSILLKSVLIIVGVYPFLSRLKRLLM